mmetsp:Transcript_38562/g.56305  ORF Transcript_38562/g.56305 Transcript_38562/m.56305 type:complete len:151 (-) Transcript_38562:321-773(-)
MMTDRYQKVTKDKIPNISRASWSDIDSSVTLTSNDTQDSIEGKKPIETKDNFGDQEEGIEELLKKLPQDSPRGEEKYRQRRVLTEFGWVDFPTPTSSCQSLMSSVGMMSSTMCLKKMKFDDLDVEWDDLEEENSEGDDSGKCKELSHHIP